jgi:hypothetical protein
MKKRTEYAVKVGKRLYLQIWNVDPDDDRFDSRDNFNEDNLTSDQSDAKRWPLSRIVEVSEAAAFVGGRVVRFKTVKRRVVVAEHDS